MAGSILIPALVDSVENAVAAAVGGTFRLGRAIPVSGGCISRNFRIESPGREHYFLKLGTCAREMFAAEADGLAALARCPLLVVPRMVCRGSAGADDFLVLEWLDVDEAGDEARLGEAVAALHGLEFPRFGWHRDNFIGSTPQANGEDDSWPRFFAERRLRPQLRLATDRDGGRLAEAAAPLLAELPRLLAGHRPVPGLVHGDLWGGNKGFVGGRPALFDPAVYAGDGETDLAMGELFGGFGPRFHAAYRSLRPGDRGYPVRRCLYQLYHVLNHYHLFGGSYGRQAGDLIADLLRELQ